MAQAVDQRGQDILMRFEPDGRLPCGIYAAQGSVDELDALIEEDSKQAEALDSYKETPLHIACLYGRFNVVKYLIREYQVKVDMVNWEGWTPMFCAIRGGFIEIADFLLRNGANINHTTPSGSTAMHIAAYYHQPDSIEFLIHKMPKLLRKGNDFDILPLGMPRPGPIKRLLFNAAEEVYE